jgi:hypothetical protein
MLYPPVEEFKAAGTMGLMAGLILIGIAVSLVLVESIFTRKEIGGEIADLDDEARQARP